MRELQMISLSGKWQDRYLKNGEIVSQTDVQHNQIQDSAYLAVAALLANQFYQQNQPVETPTTYGISHVDYGQGDATWDLPENQPIPQDPSDTTLTSATYRQIINPNQITFVPEDDPFGGSAVSLLPTNRIRIALVLTEQEFTGSLREFGLFCRFTDDANQASQVNQGLIFNWVIHPLIEKDASLRIERVIEISINRS
jgi:hypothetical protein